MSTATHKQALQELESLVVLGWRYDFALGEWKHDRPLDSSQLWRSTPPSYQVTELLLSVAIGETCQSCLKAKSMAGRRECFHCWAQEKKRHPMLDVISIDGCEV
ncbi:MAG: hypothetical protein ACK5YR_03875 [Pirellula sp.]